MSERAKRANHRRFVIGAGAAACAVCCAGPIVGVLAAIGLTSLAGEMWFGVGALVIGLLAAALVVARRRRRSTGARCVHDHAHAEQADGCACEVEAVGAKAVGNHAPQE
jgi:ABC-type nickel/cobalt efflux system permease component RcnA